MRGTQLFIGAWAISAMAVATAAESTSVAPPSTVPIESFFTFVDMSEPVLSPSGDALAILVRNKAGRRQLAILTTADLTKAKIVASYQDMDVEDVQWVNNDRLVYALHDESVSAFENRGGNGLLAVDRTGENQRTLIYMRGQASEVGTAIKSRTLPNDYWFSRTLSDGSNDVIIEHVLHTSPLGALVWQITGTTPLRLNTRTGATSDAVAGKLPDNVQDWVFDGMGKVAAAVVDADGVERVLSPDRYGNWQERVHFESFTRANGFSIIGAAADGHVYASRSKPAPDDTQALYMLDLDAGKPQKDPILSVKGFDIAPQLLEDERNHKLLGVRYQADAEGTAWFDPELKALQEKIDARLPGLINRIDLASCACASRVLVTSFSDRQPNLFFLYDRTDGTLIPIGASRPAIQPRQMADTDFVRIKARDGADLPIYVTRPHGKGPWPTVVLVHGGPFLRGWHWNWNGEAEFLASRGYLVVRPEYRGSTGYGYAHFKSGFKQWGLAMQDDIADATRWAAEQGLEDPQRTCIAGASYGGYATLMGLVRYPDLYRCGVAWAAVTDINLMYDIGWSDMGDEWKGYGMPTMVGDQVKDAAQLQATSPLQQAARITRPLLLAHGGIDRRVPIEQAVRLRNALEAAHAPLTWIEYKDEAHGWYKPETRIEFYKRMEAFLSANIGPGASQNAAAPQ